jgi:GxxExxY protein
MAIHNQIGPGYKEEIYERALATELTLRGIGVQAQHPVLVEHDDGQVGLFYLDLFAEGLVVVEIKAFSHQLTNDELAQVINYLKATSAPVGLLFNFGSIEALRSDRNKVAHTQTVDAALARGIREAVLGQHGQPGLLYRLCSSLNPPPDAP